MKPIVGKVSSFRPGSSDLQAMPIEEVRRGAGHKINTYSELISKLAQLAFANPDFVMLLRGQSRDYLEDGRTTLFPSMYRTPSHGDEFYAFELRQRYQQLEECEKRLYRVLKGTEYRDRVGRSELARWAILQHYEVCPTPLLDVTHSALVACSFANLGKSLFGDRLFLYVLGVPQINGSITVAPTHDLQVIRLSSVCPPETLRPYFQEGYLLGTYPSVDVIDDKMRYARSEMDCAQRLIAKFTIPKSPKFWDQGFKKLPESAVYPEESGNLCASLNRLRKECRPPT